MEPANIEDSETSESDDNADILVAEYLNDTRVESVLATRRHQEPAYTLEQLDDINLYKNAIALNRETEAKYKKLEDSLTRMLTEVRKRLKDNEAALLKHSHNHNEGEYNYFRCGKPYFKDSSNFCPPDNEDTIMMRQSEMYDFSHVASVPGWTINDKGELVNALLEVSRDIKTSELKSEIARLRKDNKNLMKIAKLEQEIKHLNKKTLAEIALPIEQEYDWEQLADTMNQRHTAQEYRALWKLFFHPSINKSSWTKPEHKELQKIAFANYMQDWDSIAKQLNTGRTGYQCFVYYRTNLTSSPSNRKWTPEEIEYLQRVVDYFREGTYIPWGKVASAVDNRTKIQVYNKYMRMLHQRKGRFLEEEDVVLINCYEKYGSNFKKIAQFLPGRSVVQLKTRYQILTKFRVSTTWTVDDDKKLLQLMANQDSSISFASTTRHFPGKDRTNIRSRYVTLMKWMKAHPTCDISLAPRRGARRLIHGLAEVNLNEAIANLNKRLESEVNTKKKNKITLESREDEIEAGIMAALVNEIVVEESGRKPSQQDLDDEEVVTPHGNMLPNNVTNLRNLLILFNAALDKEAFEHSKYNTEFPGLRETDQKDSIVRVKSYSKTKTVQTIEMDKFPDIWGKQTVVKPVTYVLPPNYATITGCRVLMKHYGTKPDDDINLSVMQRHNNFLKQAIDTIKQRFTALFLWPMLLSNEMPNVNQTPYVSPIKVEKKLLPNPKGVTIPHPKKCQMNFHKKPSQLYRYDDDDDDDEDEEINAPKRRKKKDLKKIQYFTKMPLKPMYSKHKNIFGSDESDFD